MENASKSLLIAGSILICIILVAVGMYIYNTSGTKIQSSMDSMSTQELETFNIKYTMYEGEQTGANIKSLIGVLTSNASTNEDETTKIPGVCLENNNEIISSSIPKNGEITSYLDSLQKIRQCLENKHKYWVEVNYQKNGLIDYINISYDKNHLIEPMKRN